MLITVYFPLKNKEFDYTKCIIDEDTIDFFLKLGALKTQIEAEEFKRKPGRPKKINIGDI